MNEVADQLNRKLEAKVEFLRKDWVKLQDLWELEQEKAKHAAHAAEPFSRSPGGATPGSSHLVGSAGMMNDIASLLEAAEILKLPRLAAMEDWARNVAESHGFVEMRARTAAKMPMRNFDLREELKATADRRKPTQERSAIIGHKSTTGGVGDIAARLAEMFPALPADTVQGAVSQLFRSNAECSPLQLADMSLAALLEMSSTGPQAVTSFEPVCTSDCVENEAEANRQVVIEEAHEEADDILDGLLADLFGLPDDEMKVCVKTLCGILSRVVEQPSEQLRKSNARFAAEVGCHPQALALMSYAGFEEDAEASASGTRKTRKPFHEALQEAGETLRDARRQHIAALTEMRLKDPRGFQEARRSSRGNRGVGGTLARPSTASPAAPSRRAQHFTLSDLEKMRVQEEIAGMPSYADEYRLSHQSAPATNYSTLVARSYDPELIARQALDGTNRYRASKGLPPLRWNDGIARIARDHAEQMASGAAPFSHDGVDQRFRAYPVAHQSAAENLALNNGIADEGRGKTLTSILHTTSPVDERPQLLADDFYRAGERVVYCKNMEALGGLATVTWAEKLPESFRIRVWRHVIGLLCLQPTWPASTVSTDWLDGRCAPHAALLPPEACAPRAFPEQCATRTPVDGSWVWPGRNWCWVATKRHACYGHHTWEEAAEVAEKEMEVVKATEGDVPLRRPELCDVRAHGRPLKPNETASVQQRTSFRIEAAEASFWFDRNVAVYVVSLPSAVLRWNRMQQRLQERRFAWPC
eukprot:g4421.t1